MQANTFMTVDKKMTQRGNHRKCMAFVLGGGGPRGALQVGAMRALFEVGIVPDLLVGTSIGAVNATGLALWGVNMAGIDALERAWGKGSDAQLLDPRISQLILRALLDHPSNHAKKKIEEFFISMGIDHNLRFEQIGSIRLGLISADIQTGQPVIYGQDLSESILEGLLSSVALPPWSAPFQKDARLIIDGGALSNLAIEPALRMGATEIIALDLDDDPTPIPAEKLTFTQYFEKYTYALSRRHVYLEKALAEEQGIPVHCIKLRGLAKDPIWDFSNYQQLISAGYEKTRTKIVEWNWIAQPECAIPDFYEDKQRV